MSRYSLEGFLSVNHMEELSTSKTFGPQKGLLQLQGGGGGGGGQNNRFVPLLQLKKVLLGA